MSDKKSLVKDVGIYSIASQATQFISMIAGILTRNFLGPKLMGILATFQIILDYSKYTTLGTTNATGREIPYFIGKNEPDKATQIKNLVATFAVGSAMITALGIALYALCFRDVLPEYFFYGLLYTSALVFLQRVNNLLISLLRAYKLFGIASHQMVFSAIVNVLLILALAFPFQLYGFLTAMLLSFLFNIIYILWHHPFNFKIEFGKALVPLIQFGLPLMILGVATSLLKSIDKILILKMLDFQSMGYYSVALMAGSFLDRVPNAIGVVLIPYFQEKYAVRDDSKDIRSTIDESIYGLRYLVILCVIGAWIYLPLAIELMMPEFVAGTRAAQILVCASYFFALSVPYGNLIITVKKHMKMFPIIAISIIAATILNYYAIVIGWGIEGVAIATVFVSAIHFFLLFFVSKKLVYESGEVSRVLSVIIFGFLGMILFLWGADFFLSKLFNSDVQLIVWSILYSFFCFGVFRRLDARYQIVCYLKQKFNRKKRNE